MSKTPSTSKRRSHLLRSLLVITLLSASWSLHASLGGASGITASMQTGERVLSQAKRTIRETRTSFAENTPEFSAAIEERSTLLTRSLSVDLLASGEAEAKTLASFEIKLSEHPLWVVFDTKPNDTPVAVVSEKRIMQFLKNEKPYFFPAPRSCTLLSEWEDGGVLRAQTTCIAQDGYTIDEQNLVQRIRAALEQGKTEINAPLTFVASTITGQEGTLLAGQELTLLSTGHSDFKGSGLNRKSNVRKALNERVHNILVPEGATFSFNQTLGPVTLSKGWQMALTIFDGVDLRPAPGGGICQASTTVYRAALRAGLPIVKQKNHSLYVTYYEAHGVGQDATIFPGQQDLRFLNDTGAPLLIQSYNDGDEAFVKFYGKDDGRRVALSGPYFTSTAPEGEKVRSNEILWQRTVEMPQGENKSENFLARYKAIPKSLPARSTLVTEQTRIGTIFHAAALSD